MSDCLIFAVLFATYGVLGASLAGGPGPRDLFDLRLVALNTTMLLDLVDHLRLRHAGDAPRGPARRR